MDKKDTKEAMAILGKSAKSFEEWGKDQHKLRNKYIKEALMERYTEDILKASKVPPAGRGYDWGEDG